MKYFLEADDHHNEVASSDNEDRREVSHVEWNSSEHAPEKTKK